MVKVQFLGPINQEELVLDISTLAELAVKLQENIQLQEWLPNCSVAVNDTITNTPDHPLKDGDVISILPPVCGG